MLTCYICCLVILNLNISLESAPFWANLFLYMYENGHRSELISNDKVEARHFHQLNVLLMILVP